MYFEQTSLLKVLHQPDGWRKHNVVTLFSTETLSHSEIGNCSVELQLYENHLCWSATVQPNPEGKKEEEAGDRGRSRCMRERRDEEEAVRRGPKRNMLKSDMKALHPPGHDRG